MPPKRSADDDAMVANAAFADDSEPPVTCRGVLTMAFFLIVGVIMIQDIFIKRGWSAGGPGASSGSPRPTDGGGNGSEVQTVSLVPPPPQIEAAATVAPAATAAALRTDATAAPAQTEVPPENGEPEWLAVAPQQLSDAALIAAKKLVLGSVPVLYPRRHVLQLTSEPSVAQRNIAITELFPCFGSRFNRSGDAPLSPPRYDVAFIPVGCFGDPVPAAGPCLSTSCRHGPLLAEATWCGMHRFGAFTGDNFYPSGLRKPTDRRFEHDLRTKYWQFPELQMRFFATVGNHDKKPHTQLRTDHPFWVMPAFRHVSPVQQWGKTTVQLFLVDTHFGFERNTADLMRAEADWLDSALRNSSARWKVVASHEPLWGFLDFTHNAGMIEALHPVIVRHRVPLFIAAHAHSVHLHRCKGGYHQLVSAGYADNFHSHAKPRRPDGHYHLGRGGAAVFFNHDYADVAAFDTARRAIFAHRIPHPDTPLAEATKPSADFDASPMWKVTPQCQSYLPYVPEYCKPSS